MTEAPGYSQDSQGEPCMAVGQSLLHSVVVAFREARGS